MAALAILTDASIPTDPPEQVATATQKEAGNTTKARKFSCTKLRVDGHAAADLDVLLIYWSFVHQKWIRFNASAVSAVAATDGGYFTTTYTIDGIDTYYALWRDPAGGAGNGTYEFVASRL